MSQRASRAQDPDGDGDGDLGDFEAIYRDHLAFVWRALRSLGVPESTLEDATHEVFVVVHRRWGDWDRRSKMTTWLYGIAKGVARNASRTRRRFDRKLQAVRDEVRAEPERFDATDLAGELDRRRAARWLEVFLERLDPTKRQIFFLCEVEGLAATEVARCLDLNPNTVATRLRRARHAFRDYVRTLQEGRP